MNSWILIINWMLLVFLFWFETFTLSERVALAAAFLVLIGVAGEYIIEIPTIEERKRVTAAIKRLSMTLLLLGLTGDILGIVMGQAEMAALTKTAGNAAKSARNAALDAKQAHDLAQSASNSAGDAQTKAGNADTVAGEAQQKASSALSLARDAGTEADAVATETKELSFRSTVLLDAEDEIVKAVSPFREQKDLIESCGEAQKPDRWNNDRESSEKWETRYVLAHLVETEGSWRRLSKRQNWGDCDRPWVGIFVFVNTDAPRKTIQAAEALSTVLTSVLPPRRPEVLQLVNPANTGHVDDSDHPFAMVEDHPDLIVVLIGAQPVPDITRKPQSNEPKTGPKPPHLLPPSP